MIAEYVSIVFAIFLIIVMIIMLITALPNRRLRKLTKKSYKFEIVYSAGAYDVRLNGIRLISKSTYDEAKGWLDVYKEHCMSPDQVDYTEEYVVAKNGKIIRIR